MFRMATADHPAGCSKPGPDRQMPYVFSELQHNVKKTRI